MNLLNQLEFFLTEAKSHLNEDELSDPDGIETSTGYTAYRCLSAQQVSDVIDGIKYTYWNFALSQNHYNVSTHHGNGLFYIFLKDGYHQYLEGEIQMTPEEQEQFPDLDELSYADDTQAPEEYKKYVQSMIAVSFDENGQVCHIYPRINSCAVPESVSHLEKLVGIRFADLNLFRTDQFDDSPFKIENGRLVALLDKKMTEVIIPDGVTKIEMDAFRNNTSIINVRIPNSVVNIEKQAFDECEALQSVQLSSNLRVISSKMFESCTNLREVTNHDRVKEIMYFAFHNCKSLTQFRFPNHLIKIGSGAFSGCDALTRIHMPDSVEEVESHAFAYCKGLREVRLSRNHWNIRHDTFLQCTALEEIRIPNVRIIEENAFNGCSSLKRVVVSNSLEKVHRHAFDNHDVIVQV